MSGLPAATIGMVDRGLLAVGMAADIVVFDAGTIIDHATFEQPTLPSEGVRFVWVNGQLAIENGAPTLAKAGQPLRRLDYMPTRPMDLPATRRTLKGDSPARDSSDLLAMISVDLMQGTPDRRAHGHVWVGTPAAHTIEMFEFGVMQTADHWVSVTGRGASREGGGEQTMTLTVDGDSLYLTSAGGLSVKYPFRRVP